MCIVLKCLEAVSSPLGLVFVHSSFITSDVENSHIGCMCEYLKVSTPIKIPHRINELRRDDEVQAKVLREINHEREMTSAIQMSQSWDEHFSLVSLALASHQTNLNTGCICLIHSREALMWGYGTCYWDGLAQNFASTVWIAATAMVGLCVQDLNNEEDSTTFQSQACGIWTEEQLYYLCICTHLHSFSRVLWF